jgi:hypothetical protein
MKYHGDEVIQGYKNARALDEAVTVGKDGSWVMEVEVSRKAFAGRGVHTKFGPNVTYGFELAVGSKDDPTKRIYYFSGPKAETDTSVFGSIVLEE